MPSYKLTYFPLRALAEVSRVLFQLGGQEYEDVPVTFEEWPKHKATMPFQQVPVLEVHEENGEKVVIAQSGSIERYLAKKFNLLGKSDLEQARIDMVCEQVNDLHRNLLQLYGHIYFRKPGYEAKKAELEKTLDEMGTSLKLIEAIYADNQAKSGNSGFLIGDKVSYADIKLINFYDWLNDKKSSTLDQVPGLKQHYEKIRGLAQLKEFYEARDKVPLTIYF